MLGTMLQELSDVVDSFRERGIDYALCGGLAVAVHGHVRATKDIDLLVREPQIADALDVLRTLGYDIVAGPIQFQAGTSREQRLYRASRTGGPELLTVDLLVVTPILEDVWLGREVLDWGGRELRAVSLAGLTRMKLMAGRRQDLADLENLGVEVPDDV